MTAEQPFAPTQEAAAPAASSASALSLHVALSALAGFIAVLIWGLTGGGYFWAGWVIFGLAIPVAVHVVIARAVRAPPGPRVAFEAQAGGSAIVVAILVLLWGLTDSPTFWPIWSILGLGTALAVHGLLIAQGWIGASAREEVLVERVDELTRTAAG